MTTIRQIISDAYEEARLIPLGGTPEADEADKGFRELQRLIESVYGFEFGNQMEDVLYGKEPPRQNFYEWTKFFNQDYISPNTRVLCNLESATTLYLPPRPQNGAQFAVVDIAGNFSTKPLTINANGLTIEGSTSVVLNTNNIEKLWVYLEDGASGGNWEPVNTLTINSDMPFPIRFDVMFITMLAMRLSPTFGKQMSQESMTALNRSKQQFRATYTQKQEMPSELALWFPNRYYWGYSTNAFNRGYI